MVIDVIITILIITYYFFIQTQSFWNQDLKKFGRKEKDEKILHSKTGRWAGTQTEFLTILDWSSQDDGNDGEKLF